MQKISISGASGFVGKNLVSYLADRSYLLQDLQLRNVQGDFLFNDADIVVHLAGKAHDLKNTSAPEEYYQVNFKLTKKLYDAFLASGASKFIFISSVKAAADHTQTVLTEEVIPGPITDYGKSKLMAEQYIQSQKLPPGKSFYILRPCMIHGPGNKGNFNLLYRFIVKGLPYPLGKFDNRRSFLSVSNLCFVIHELIGKEIEPGLYNVSDDESLSTNELIAEIGYTLGIKPRIWYVNKTIVKFMAKTGDALGLPFNSSRLQKLTENFEVSNQKLMNALQVRLPLSVKEGIHDTVEWFKKP